MKITCEVTTVGELRSFLAIEPSMGESSVEDFMCEQNKISDDAVIIGKIKLNGRLRELTVEGTSSTDIVRPAVASL